MSGRRSMTRLRRCNASCIKRELAVDDMVVDAVLVEKNEFRVRGGQEDLATELGEQRKQPPVAGAVEFARYVVEQQDRHAAHALFEFVQLRDFERQHDRAVLALGREAFGAAVVEPEHQIVRVGPISGEPAREILAQRCTQRPVLAQRR